MSSIYTVIAILFALLLQLGIEALLAVGSWRMQIVSLLLLLLLLLIVVLAVAALVLLLRDLLGRRLKVENFRPVAEIARLVSHRRPVSDVIDVTIVVRHLVFLFRLVVVHHATLRLSFGQQSLLLRQAGSTTSVVGRGRLRLDLAHHVAVRVVVVLLTGMVAFGRTSMLFIAIWHRYAADNLHR